MICTCNLEPCYNGFVVGMQAASCADDNALQVANHEILQRLWQLLQCESRYLALGSFLQKLLHPDIRYRATAQEALADSSFWATA